MLSSGVIRISEIYLKVRIIHPEFYELALKASSELSVQRMHEDLQLLRQDIQECSKLMEQYHLFSDKRETMKDILHSFDNNNRVSDNSGLVEKLDNG